MPVLDRSLSDCRYGLATLAADGNATWVLQQLISDLRAPEEVTWVQIGLAGHVTELLFAGGHGGNVIVRCIQEFTSGDAEFIIDEICARLMTCACDKQCNATLQILIGSASDTQMVTFANELVDNDRSVSLATDAVGNYFVQHVLDR